MRTKEVTETKKIAHNLANYAKTIFGRDRVMQKNKLVGVVNKNKKTKIGWRRSLAFSKDNG